MTYKPIVHGGVREDRTRYAIITPSPCLQYKYLVVPIEHLSEALDEFDENDGRMFNVKVVDRTKRWIEKFQEL